MVHDELAPGSAAFGSCCLQVCTREEGSSLSLLFFHMHVSRCSMQTTGRCLQLVAVHRKYLSYKLLSEHSFWTRELKSADVRWENKFLLYKPVWNVKSLLHSCDVAVLLLHAKRSLILWTACNHKCPESMWKYTQQNWSLCFKGWSQKSVFSAYNVLLLIHCHIQFLFVFFLLHCITCAELLLIVLEGL